MHISLGLKLYMYKCRFNKTSPNARPNCAKLGAILSCVILVFGRGLNNTLASIAGRRDTSEGISTLSLFKQVSQSYPSSVKLKYGDVSIYLEKLVRGLLVLLVHGVRCRLGGNSDGSEESERGGKANGNSPGNTGTGSGSVNGAGAVRAEGDPVSYCHDMKLAAEEDGYKC